jgi:uncharacterized membrane protein
VVHLIANGDVASFIFFCAFAVTALAGTVSIDAKRRRAFGPRWQSFAAHTSGKLHGLGSTDKARPNRATCSFG